MRLDTLFGIGLAQNNLAQTIGRVDEAETRQEPLKSHVLNVGLNPIIWSQTIDRADWSELSRVAFEQSASAMDSVCVFGELFIILEL